MKLYLTTIVSLLSLPYYASADFTPSIGEDGTYCDSWYNYLDEYMDNLSGNMIILCAYGAFSAYMNSTVDLIDDDEFDPEIFNPYVTDDSFDGNLCVDDYLTSYALQLVDMLALNYNCNDWEVESYETGNRCEDLDEKLHLLEIELKYEDIAEASLSCTGKENLTVTGNDLEDFQCTEDYHKNFFLDVTEYLSASFNCAEDNDNDPEPLIVVTVPSKTTVGGISKDEKTADILGYFAIISRRMTGADEVKITSFVTAQDRNLSIEIGFNLIKKVSCEGDCDTAMVNAKEAANSMKNNWKDFVLNEDNSFSSDLFEVFSFSFEETDFLEEEPASAYPSVAPSVDSSKPTLYPTSIPSSKPSDLPSSTPSLYPTSIPSSKPSDLPSLTPSLYPTAIPSSKPSDLPSSTPSLYPDSSESPSADSSESPTDKDKEEDGISRILKIFLDLLQAILDLIISLV